LLCKTAQQSFLLDKKAKANYYELVISKQSSDPIKLWNTVNTALGRINKLKQALNKLQLPNSSVVTISKEIAYSFNKNNTEIGPNLAKKIPEICNSPATHFRQKTLKKLNFRLLVRMMF